VTKSANPWVRATATRPAGESAASLVKLAGSHSISIKIHQIDGIDEHKNQSKASKSRNLASWLDLWVSLAAAITIDGFRAENWANTNQNLSIRMSSYMGPELNSAIGYHQSESINHNVILDGSRAQLGYL
jgi:hypothetical protein